MNRQLIIIKKILFYGLFAVNLAIIFFFWYHNSGPLLMLGSSGILIALGRICGLLAEYLILVQLVLIGRVKPLESMYGHDKLNWLHRQNGVVIATVLVFHPIFLIIGYAQGNSVGLVAQFLDFWSNWHDVSKAVFAFLILMFVVGASLTIVRKKLRYETWYGVHLFVYLAIFLAFDHQTKTADVSFGSAYGYWLALNFIVFGAVLLYRFIRPFYLFSRHGFTVEKVVEETPDIFSVYIAGRNMEKFVFRPGQFANLIFLNRNMFFGHPFSFSAAPNGKYVRFSIKSLGNYSSKISELRPGTKVIIDGPLGTFTADRAETSKYLLIAAGIGITPISSLAQSLSDEKKDAVLLYGFKSPSDAALKGELDSLSFPVHFFVSQSSNDMAHGFEQGRISVHMIAEYVPDFLDRDIYVCGPQGMVAEISGHLQDQGVAKRRIHYELFSY